MRLLQTCRAVHLGACRLLVKHKGFSPGLTHIRFASARPSTWDYETEKKTFKLKPPEYYNFAKDVIDFWAAKEKVANFLTGPCNLKPGHKLIIILPRVPEWWLINIAAIRAGIILSSGTTLLRSNDIRYRLNASQAKCIITNSAVAEKVEGVAKDCPSLESQVIVGSKRTGWLNFDELMLNSTDTFPTYKSRYDDPMTVFFTSGTTGSPKMAEHTHSSYGLGHLITAKYFLDLKPTDVLWNLSDTGWAKCAWSSFFAPWIAGACVFAQDSAKFDPEMTLKTLDQYPVSHFCAAPSAVRFMVKSNLDHYRFTSLVRCVSAGEPVVLGTWPISVFCAPPTAVRHLQITNKFQSLRNCSLVRAVCGAEPVNPELLQEWHDGTGLKLLEGYGQTETTFLCGTYDSIEQRPGSMGKAAPGYDLEIVDTEGNVLPRGTEGEVGIRCKPERPCGLFTRYIDDEPRMEKAFVSDFYLTGDRAIMDEDGYVWFVGRSDDVIISSGIGPFEVESALLEHPAVLESAVVSCPDKIRGEIVSAFVTLTDDYKTADKAELVHQLQEHCKEVTAPYKYPRKIEFVDSLPKTISGKIRRVELRNKQWERPETT